MKGEVLGCQAAWRGSHLINLERYNRAIECSVFLSKAIPISPASSSKAPAKIRQHANRVICFSENINRKSQSLLVGSMERQH